MKSKGFSPKEIAEYLAKQKGVDLGTQNIHAPSAPTQPPVNIPANRGGSTMGGDVKDDF
jgi:hypothetical protein